MSRGNTLRRYGRCRDALRCYDRAIDLDPSCVNAWIEKGRLFQQMGNLELALRRFNRALEIDPACAEAWEDKGRILRELGKRTEADSCSLKVRELVSRAY